MADDGLAGEAAARRYAVLRPYLDERQRRLLLGRARANVAADERIDLGERHGLAGHHVDRIGADVEGQHHAGLLGRRPERLAG